MDYVAKSSKSKLSVRFVLHAAQFSLIIAFFAAMFLHESLQESILAVGLGLSIFMFIAGCIAGRLGTQQFAVQMKMAEEASNSRNQTEQLFNMTDMLQSADGNDDAGAVLMSTTRKLMPDYRGTLYVFNNSRDRLDIVTSWGDRHGNDRPSDSLLPSNCWALKRGKVHINDPNSGTICCMHHIHEGLSVEVPMMARGAIHGLLVLETDLGQSPEELEDAARLGRALADSMSLALSNIALHEKLRTQSLRDPLTGLYNRRYMEDALERYISLSERSGAPTSVLMIDLDDFKRLNDEHGHAKGDAVLRDVAAQLVGGLRPSDVVARYGGEELMVILPGCDLSGAQIKAETLRARVEELSDAHNSRVSASFGVATIPETSSSAVDIVAQADAALYQAKAAGKNCVRSAEVRAQPEKPSPEKPRLAVG